MAPLSSEQGYVLALHWPKFGLPVDLQRLIWADVKNNYYRRLGDTLDPAYWARVLQASWRRLRAIINHSSTLYELNTSRERYDDYRNRATRYEQRKRLNSRYRLAV